jgi:hypothetical protein
MIGFLESRLLESGLLRDVHFDRLPHGMLARLSCRMLGGRDFGGVEAA